MSIEIQKLIRVSIVLSAALLMVFVFSIAFGSSLMAGNAGLSIAALQSETTAKVLLHNDIIDGGMRHVYIENAALHKVMVRARIKEYFQMGNHAVVGISADAPDTWQPHISGTCTLECHEFFTFSMTGASKNYLKGINSNTDFYEDSQKGSLVSGFEVAQTLPASPVITMAAYISQIAVWSDENTDACWVADPDGWYYWSKPLPPGEATNLLVDGVVLEGQRPDDKHYFAFHVEFEAQMLENMEGMYDGLSDDAVILTATAIQDNEEPDGSEAGRFTSYTVPLETLAGGNAAAEEYGE